MTLTTTELDVVRENVPVLHEFRLGGNLHGGHPTITGGGLLPNPWLRRFRRLVDDNRIDYAVFHVSTPVAWHTTNDVWHLPDLSSAYQVDIRNQIAQIVAEGPLYPGCWVAAYRDTSGITLMTRVRQALLAANHAGAASRFNEEAHNALDADLLTARQERDIVTRIARRYVNINDRDRDRPYYRPY